MRQQPRQESPCTQQSEMLLLAPTYGDAAIHVRQVRTVGYLVGIHPATQLDLYLISQKVHAY